MKKISSFIALEKQAESLPLTAAHNASSTKRQMNTLAKAHENLMVALPKTALGWHQQLFIGLLLMFLAPLALRTWAK